MPINRNSEISALRSVLRDLMALSALPMAWIGREPVAVVAGLADTLIELLQLEFVFVRSCVPGVTGGVDVTRGNANTWAMFPEYVEAHLAKAGWLPSMEITSDLGRGSEPGRGLVIPIGVNAEGGVIAATSDRIDFPAETDRLLLRLAANHAAAVFQGARLIEERTRAEEELRKAREELEVKVVERTGELRRSEAYLSAMVRDLRESERKLERSRAELAASRA